MRKIIKTESRQWQGNGFGTSAAQWAVENNPEIRVKRESGLWIAIGGGVGRIASESRKGLEARIADKLA